MLDVGRALAFAWAMVLAVRARSRVALLALGVVGYLYALEVANGFSARDRGSLSAGYAFMLAFVGPSGMPRGGTLGWPLGSFVIAHPILAKLATAGILVGPWQRLSRQARQLRPELDEARRRDRASLQIMLLVVFDLIVAVMFATLRAWSLE
jgi:hypothetical protein